jgi:hypothetical protein
VNLQKFLTSIKSPLEHPSIVEQLEATYKKLNPVQAPPKEEEKGKITEIKPV